MEKEYPFYVLIETSGSNKDHDDEVMFDHVALACLYTLLILCRN